MTAILVYIIAGLGAGIGTGLAGLSAAAIISPMLIAFLDFSAYEAVGIALASDVLASAVSAYTYAKNKNIDIKNGSVMMCAVLLFTVIGSFVASLMPDFAMGSFSIIMCFVLGLKFILRPVMTTKEARENRSARQKFKEAVISGSVIGSICGFIGAGGGMMMLLILTSVIGYELKTAVGTSVFIMTFSAFTGAASHFLMGGIPNLTALAVCILATLVGARFSALFANGANSKTLNRVTGIVLAILGAAMIFVKFIL
ncbi:MAG: sulfite exporter TauE/SafE family protein [Clostridia bacterium]|nr:sulfite exporter TauE/SafE family protein [Clostridia bacterium]